MYNLNNAIELLVKVYHKRQYIMENDFRDTYKKLDDFECRIYAGCILARYDDSGMYVNVMRPRENRKNSGVDIFIGDDFCPKSFFYRKGNNVIFQCGTDHLFDNNSTTDEHFNAMIDDNMIFSLDDIKFGIKQLEQVRSYCNITYKNV